MKPILFARLALLLPLLATAPTLAQEAASGAPGYHQHDGFYLSLIPGIAFGNVKLDADGGWTDTFKGAGGTTEIRIGGAVRPNLILSFDLITRTIKGPDVTTTGPFAYGNTDNLRISEGIVGLGVTYYIMPHNIFVSGTIGSGRILLVNNSTDNGSSTDGGLALNLKVGKEWWVSNNWGLGIAGGYGHVGAKDGDFYGSFSSNKLFLQFNTTYN